MCIRDRSMAIAEGLHRKGKRTLLVDLDQQMNATQQAKIDTTDEVTVYDLLTSFDYTAKDGIKHFDGGDVYKRQVLNGSDSTSNPYGFSIAEAIVSKIVTANAARAFGSSLLSNRAASGNMIAQGQSAPCRLAIQTPRNGKPNRNLISRLLMYFSINSQETARHRISSARGVDRRL